ncbi:MAG: YARHG domain-containing protein [Candidatus Zhuqueibacterota bacterium]
MVFFRGLILVLLGISFFYPQPAVGLIGPVRPLSNRQVMFVACDEIKLVHQELELYHHPLGIWIAEYQAHFQNLQNHVIYHRVAFPAGFDVQMIEGQEYCDRFEQFQVFVNDKPVTNINKMVPCTNYVSTTGVQWSVEIESGVGYVNVWDLNIQPEEKLIVKVTFSFIVKKPPSIYDPTNQETWYIDLMRWVRQDYEARPENHFQFPMSIGSFWAFYPDDYEIRTYVGADWFNIMEKEKRIYEESLVKRFEYSEPVGIYTPPELELHGPTEAELQTMTREQLIILRNSFFAKYGRKFDIPWLRDYFMVQPWYYENPGYDNWLLTGLDIEAMKLVQAAEKNLNTRRKKP